MAAEGRDAAGVADFLRRTMRPGDTLFVATGVGEPATLIEAFIAAAPEVGNLRVIQVMTGGEERLAEASGNGFRLLSPVPGPITRRAIKEGRAELFGLSMGQIAAGFATGRLPVEGVLVSASTPVEGWATLGLVGDCGPLAYGRARFRAVEINPALPRSGRGIYDLALADVVIQSDDPLRAQAPIHPSSAALRIGQYVAEIVPDGATFELGPGKALAGVAQALSAKRDLAVHTGILDDDIMGLVERGVVSRPLESGSGVVAAGTVAIGSLDLYRWLDRNAQAEVQDSTSIHAPEVLARRSAFVAINGVFQVDLVGQANSIGFGARILGGVGGALDFAAAGARGVASIVALTSVSDDGRSRIAVSADWVSLPMSLVTHVVTEWGIASLYGKAPMERIQAVVAVAHPEHRAGLLKAARDRGVIA